MKIVNMGVMANRRVPAVRAMLVGMVGMVLLGAGDHEGGTQTAFDRSALFGTVSRARAARRVYRFRSVAPSRFLAREAIMKQVETAQIFYVEMDSEIASPLGCGVKVKYDMAAPVSAHASE